MEKLKVSPSKISNFGVNIAKDGISRSSSQILSQKGVRMDKIREIWPEIPYFNKDIDESNIIISGRTRNTSKKSTIF